MHAASVLTRPVVGSMLLLCLATFLLFYRLGDSDLYHSHEARAAQNAQTILDEGCWGLPHLFDRRVEQQKPPLYYWLVACLGWLRGGQVDAWCVRLPAALAALATILFVYLVLCRRGRPLAGFFAAAGLATFLHFTAAGRVGRIDMPLTFVVTLALGGFLLAEDSRRAVACKMLGYIAIALGILLKGPIAAVLVAAAGLAYWAVSRLTRFAPSSDPSMTTTEHSPRQKLSSLWWGIPLVLAIAGPWFVWVNIHTNERWSYVFFYEHHILRALGEDRFEAQPWWYYVPRLAVDLLPWSLIVPWAWWTLFQARRWREDAEIRWSLSCFFGMFLLLSCVRFKRADYLVPVYPAAAVFLGCMVEWAWPRLRLRRVLAAIIIFGVTTGWAVYHEVHAVRAARASTWTYRNVGREIRERTKGPVIFFRAEAHALAFHIGNPLDTILEWENLQWWANRPETIYFVMPPEFADNWQLHLTSGRLIEVLRTPGNEARSERPLVVMRSR